MASYTSTYLSSATLGKVANVASLRGMFADLPHGSTWTTRHYALTSDTGGMSYTWDSSDNATDDGVLHIKNIFRTRERASCAKCGGTIQASSPHRWHNERPSVRAGAGRYRDDLEVV